MASASQKSGVKAPRFHLRFQILPGVNVEKRAEDLAEFCKDHCVEEIVLFFAAEEWNNGLLSRKDEDLWFDTIRRAKKVLERAGLSVSLNPWMTALHCDRGRSFPRDRRFQPAVSPLGEVSKAVASSADQRWQAYLYRLYGRFARLGFRVLWIEDDFRCHNHAPLTWGSGFDALTIKRFSSRLGYTVSRKQLLKNILRPGRPHPWRRLWLETWRELQKEIAQGLNHAVSKNSRGKSMLGLMSSNPTVHSAEGRHWHTLFAALETEGRVAHRPHFAPYSETSGHEKPYSIMMLDLQKNLRPSVHWGRTTVTIWNPRG